MEPRDDLVGERCGQCVARVPTVLLSTASRVLNGTTDAGVRSVGQEKAARIRAIAAQLGYTPDPTPPGCAPGAAT